MSPIDRELEQVLSAHATELTPRADLFSDVERQARGIRRRHNAASGAGALSVLAIAVAIPLAVRGGGGDTTPRPQPFATQPTGDVTASPTAPAPLDPTEQTPGSSTKALGWGAPRGGVSGIDGATERAGRAWSVDHPASTAYEPLWRGTLPDGRRVTAVEAIEPTRSFAVFYVEDDDQGTNGRIVQGLEVVDRNPQGPAQGKQSQTRLPQVSAYVDGPQDFVVIVGAPTTGQLEFSTDGRRYTTVETKDGIGVVAVTKGEDRTAYRVRVYDGDGVEVYDGPIDLLSES